MNALQQYNRHALQEIFRLSNGLAARRANSFPHPHDWAKFLLLSSLTLSISLT
jgi:hypothetical protein